MLNIQILISVMVRWIIETLLFIFLPLPIILVLGFIVSIILDSFYLEELAEKIVTVLAIGYMVVTITLATISTVSYTKSESFERDKREIQVRYGTEEVYREMKVVGRSGEIIYETEGHFEVERNDDLLKWVNEDGELNEVHIGNSATVIVEEVEK